MITGHKIMKCEKYKNEKIIMEMQKENKKENQIVKNKKQESEKREKYIRYKNRKNKSHKIIFNSSKLISLIEKQKKFKNIKTVK